MTYREAIKYLESFINYEQIPSYPYKESLGLERVKGFLENIGNPHLGLRCLHLAGTKGKGSTCAFLTYILREAGFKVGLYTSPHLVDFRERIRILKSGVKTVDTFEGAIPKKSLAFLTDKLKPAIDKFNAQSEYGLLTFFEVYTALAFVYFKEENVDFAVLETGLGGRLDATNVVEPLVCLITPISYEHMDKLGHTLREIAGEKAGIIKVRSSWLVGRRLNVVTAPQEKETMQVIRNRCRITGAKLYVVGKDIRYNSVHGSWFMVHGAQRKYPRLKTRLLGEHQAMNAAAAIGAIEALREYGVNINAARIKKGIENTIWPGRCEVVSREPSVVLDGAQNAASAHVLRKAIKDNFEYNKLILVLGVSGDKDAAGICGELCPLAETIILTQADSSRAMDVDDIEKIVHGSWFMVHGKVIKTRSVKEAKRIALKLAGKQDLILVTGSLFVVGEFRDDKR